MQLSQTHGFSLEIAKEVYARQQAIIAEFAGLGSATMTIPESQQANKMTTAARKSSPPEEVPTPHLQALLKCARDAAEAGPSDDGFKEPRRSTKRRKANPEPAAIPDSKNSFAVLEAMEEEAPTTQAPKRPPPVVLRDASKWTAASSLFREKNIAFLKAKSVVDGISIQAASESDFRRMTAEFDRVGFPYHSYRLQQDKPLKAVVRNVPTELTEEEVAADLREQGHPVEAVHRMHRFPKKTPISLVLVVLKKTPEAKKIFSLRTVCGLIVQVEAKRQRKGVTNQCHKCQRFHHFQSGCKAQARCVKCGGAHHTVTCDKPLETPPTCANCKGAHPASYRGCPAFPKSKNPTRPTTRPANQKPAAANFVQPARSYAAATQKPAAANFVQPPRSYAAATGATSAEPTPQIPSPPDAPAPATGLENLDLSRLAPVLLKLRTAFAGCSNQTETLSALIACLPDLLSLVKP